jgi:hypothetical protein
VSIFTADSYTADAQLFKEFVKHAGREDTFDNFAAAREIDTLIFSMACYRRSAIPGLSYDTRLRRLAV